MIKKIKLEVPKHYIFLILCFIIIWIFFFCIFIAIPVYLNLRMSEIRWNSQNRQLYVRIGFRIRSEVNLN